MFLDLFPKISDSTFECPLRRTDQGSDPNDFLQQMNKGMHTWSDEVDVSLKALAVDNLELLHKQSQYFLCQADTSHSNLMLVHDAHSKYELAVIHIKAIRKNAQKKAGAETIEILKEFPSLVPTSQLLCNVVWGTIK